MKHQLKKITPLSKFPTEALLEMYRRHRTCYDHSYYRTECRWNNNKYTYWEPVYGDFICPDGKSYHIPIYYTIVPAPIKVLSTEIEGNQERNSYTNKLYRNGMSFSWEGLYWEGELDDVKKELSTRPHVEKVGRKNYRKWLINYRKNLKK